MKDALRRGVPLWSATALLNLGDAFGRFARDLHALRDRLGDEAGVLGPWLDERTPKGEFRARDAWSLCVNVRREGGGQEAIAAQCQRRLDSVAVPPCGQPTGPRGLRGRTLQSPKDTPVAFAPRTSSPSGSTRRIFSMPSISGTATIDVPRSAAIVPKAPCNTC